MRISDWSSDVCSSDLMEPDASIEGRLKRQGFHNGDVHPARNEAAQRRHLVSRIGHPEGASAAAHPAPDREGPALDRGYQTQMTNRRSQRAKDACEHPLATFLEEEIGRAACRERVCQYV